MMTLKDLGERLRQERSRQGLSLDDIARRSKIALRALEALEAGDICSLPQLVYVKGFVKAYAGILGLDPAEFTPALEQAYFDREEEHLVERMPQCIQQPNPLRNAAASPVLFSVVLLLVLCVGGVGWYIMGSPGRNAVLQVVAGIGGADEEKEKAGSDAPAPTQESAPVATDSVPASSDAPGEKQPEAGAGALPETPTTEAARVETPPDKPADVSTTEAQSATPLPVTSGAPTTSRNADQERILEIVAREACWVDSRLDNATSKEFYLRPGERIGLHFNKTLWLRLGNAGGVKLRYEDREFPLEAKSGQVKTLTFPPGT